MRVWLVTVGEPLPIDPGTPRLLRAGAFAEYLAQQGHDVLWWTSTFDHYLKRQRAHHDQTVKAGSYRIRMLHATGYPHNLSPWRFVEHQRIAWKFGRLARRMEGPDVILCSLPTIELAYASVLYGKQEGIPVLLDVRDLWPDVFLHLVPSSLRGLLKFPLFWLERRARRALREATGIVALSESYLEWGLAKAGRERLDHDRVIPIGFQPEPDDEAADPGVAKALRELGVEGDRCICWFAGSFSRQFDWSPVVAAARRLAENGRHDVQFVLSGQGDRLARVRAEADGLENIVFTGWVGRRELAWLRRHAAIGLQPYAADVTVGLANKLFEYLSAGIPIVSSLHGESRTLLEKHGCGITYDATSAGDLYTKLLRLIDNLEIRSEMGRRAEALFHDRFSATRIHAEFEAHLIQVAGDLQPQRRRNGVSSNGPSSPSE